MASPNPRAVEVLVRPCCCPEDCESVAALCGASFPEECHGQGLSVQQWAQIEADDIKKVPSWWRQIGLACEGDKVLGVVVLTLENEADDSMSWSEYSRRVGCGPTILSMMYDHVLEEPLREHECLIDFIAVSPDARGKGVGAKLMQWAEQTGAAILAETETSAVAAHGVDMTLWVAADNTVACRLYQRSGYTVVRRTDRGACHCMASHVFKWFLGHPVWIKMRKQLPVPEHLATAKPAPVSIPLTAVAAAGPAMAEPAFEDVPLEAADQQQGQGRRKLQASDQQPSSPVGSLFRKLSHSLFHSGASAGSSTSAAASGAAAGTSCTHTPRIAAVPGSGEERQQDQQQRQQQPAVARRSWVGYHKVSSAREGLCLQLHAADSSTTGVRHASGEAELPQQQHGHSTALSTSRLQVLPGKAGSLVATAGGATPSESVASASVASLAMSDSDSEPSSPTSAQQHARSAGAAAAPSSDVFEVVALSSVPSMSVVPA